LLCCRATVAGGGRAAGWCRSGGVRLGRHITVGIGSKKADTAETVTLVVLLGIVGLSGDVANLHPDGAAGIVSGFEVGNAGEQTPKRRQRAEKVDPSGRERQVWATCRAGVTDPLTGVGVGEQRDAKHRDRRADKRGPTGRPAGRQDREDPKKDRRNANAAEDSGDPAGLPQRVALGGQQPRAGGDDTGDDEDRTDNKEADTEIQPSPPPLVGNRSRIGVRKRGHSPVYVGLVQNSTSDSWGSQYIS